MEKNIECFESTETADQQKEVAKKQYHRPGFTELGKMQEITLGGSFGTGDSAGDPVTQQP